MTDYGNGSGDYLGVDNWFPFQGTTITSPNSAEPSLGGWNFIGYEPEFVAWADARGETVRAETSFLRAGQKPVKAGAVGATSGTMTDCWNGKAYLPYNQMTLPRTDYGANNNVRIFRYAEVLLMNSEAKIRQGKTVTTAIIWFVHALKCLPKAVSHWMTYWMNAVWNFAMNGATVMSTWFVPERQLQNSDRKVGLKPRRTGLFHPISLMIFPT